MDVSTHHGTVAYMELGLVFAAVVGLVFGTITASFLCVVAERVPRGESIGGRSRCACGRQLRNRENIPVLGYLRAGGVADCCGARLPTFYLWAELLLGVWWSGAMMLATVTPFAGMLLAGLGGATLVASGERQLAARSD